jgi:hypothetical protein
MSMREISVEAYLEALYFLVVIPTSIGDRFQLSQKRAFLGQKLHMAALWADQHGVSPADAIRQESEASRAVVGQLRVAPEAGDDWSFLYGPKSCGHGLGTAWLDFHVFLEKSGWKPVRGYRYCLDDGQFFCHRDGNTAL